MCYFPNLSAKCVGKHMPITAMKTVQRFSNLEPMKLSTIYSDVQISKEAVFHLRLSASLCTISHSLK